MRPVTPSDWNEGVTDRLAVQENMIATLGEETADTDAMKGFFSSIAIRGRAGSGSGPVRGGSSSGIEPEPI